MKTIDQIILHLRKARTELFEGPDACDLAQQVPYPYNNTMLFIETALLWALETKTRLDMCEPSPHDIRGLSGMVGLPNDASDSDQSGNK